LSIALERLNKPVVTTPSTTDVSSLKEKEVGTYSVPLKIGTSTEAFGLKRTPFMKTLNDPSLYGVAMLVV
jgi:hypothetical protein